MKMLEKNIEDLKVIQSSYPVNSRGYEALRLAIVVLTQVYDSAEVASKPSIHWVLGEGGASGTINVDTAYVTLED
jgi:hypothetical protein